MNFNVSKEEVAPMRMRETKLKTGFYRTGGGSFCGFVFDPLQPDRNFIVELLVDGQPVAIDRADRPTVDVSCGSNHDFRITIDIELDTDSVVEARVANTAAPVGFPIRGNLPSKPKSEIGELHWAGGLRFVGAIAGAEAENMRLSAHIDEQLVSEFRPSGWKYLGSGGEDARVGRSFDFHAPLRFADGLLHRLIICGANGLRLPREGHLPFVAYAGGFAESFGADNPSDRQRTEHLNRLIPMSMPMSEYQEWRTRFTGEVPSVSPVDIGVITVGPGDMNETIDSLELQTASGWVAASLPPGEDACRFRIADAQAFLSSEARSSAFVVFALAGTRLAPTALQSFAGAFEKFADAAAVYADVEVIDADGRAWPIFFAEFDYDRMLEQGYCAHFFAIRRDALLAALDAGSSDIYRVFNHRLDDRRSQTTAIVHLPGVLATLPSFDPAAASETLAKATKAHLRARGDFVQTERDAGAIFPIVHVMRMPERHDAAIIIATRNQGERLRRCIDSIVPAANRRGASIIVVDSGSSDPETMRYLSELRAREITVALVRGERNAAHLANIGIAATRARAACLIDDRVQALDDRWLDELLGRLTDPDVGVCGPLMLATEDLIAHAGLVLGPGFSAAAAFSDRVLGDHGYADLLKIAHQQSALGEGVVMIRRDDYLAAGGMDELCFPNHFGYLDLCLKMRGLNKRIVVTPHAVLQRTPRDKIREDVRFERELANLRTKWGAALTNDPFYSSLLSLDGAPYSALAWRPRSPRPGILGAPVPSGTPQGF